MDTETISIPRESERRLQGVALVSVLGALGLTLLLEALDQTVVGTAMPKIIGVLHGFDRYTWVVNAYLIAAITMIPVIGKLSDQFGRKWFLLAGTAIFLLGSVLAGTSQTMDQLIAFRALQGAGSGIGMALVGTLIGDIFPPAERAKWQGIFGVVYGFASLVGPPVGGWLTENGPLLEPLVTDATRWRWVFYINLPLGIIALIILYLCLPSSISERSHHSTGWAAVRRIDFVGAALVAAATICLLLGLTWGSDHTIGWNVPYVIFTLIAAGLLYLLFLIAECFAIEPILPLRLFRNGVFAADLMLSLALGMILMGLTIYLPFFLQGVLGLTPTATGTAMIPLLISIIAGSALFGGLIIITKRYQIATIAGTLIMGIGAFLLTRMTSSTSLLEAAIYMSIAGVGMGSLFPVMTVVAQNALPPTHLGVGTGAVNYVRQLGHTLGVAIVGAVVNQSLSHDVMPRLPGALVKQLSPSELQTVTDPQVLMNPAYRETVTHNIQQLVVNRAVAHVPAGPTHDQVAASLASQVAQQTHNLLGQAFEALKLSLSVALQHGFIAVLVFCIGAILATFFLKDVPMTPPQPDEESEKVETVIERKEAVTKHRESVLVIPLMSDL